eukprot:1112663-Alexandrium_andersonii.AAC.1
MSASLVGSEMCIRDSTRWALLGRAKPRAALKLHHVSAVSAQQADRQAAVSYTHLTLPTICSV